MDVPALPPLLAAVLAAPQLGLTLALGAAVGVIMALTGAGGGILAVPLLVFGLHLPLQQAAPTGLIAVGTAAALAAVLGLREGIVRYRAAGFMSAFGMATAPAGVWLAARLPAVPMLLGFSGLLLWVAWRSLRAAPPATPRHPSTCPAGSTPPRAACAGRAAAPAPSAPRG